MNSNQTTDDIPEGYCNLYYTDTRVVSLLTQYEDIVASMLKKSKKQEKEIRVLFVLCAQNVIIDIILFLFFFLG